MALLTGFRKERTLLLLHVNVSKKGKEHKLQTLFYCPTAIWKSSFTEKSG